MAIKHGQAWASQRRVLIGASMGESGDRVGVQSFEMATVLLREAWLDGGSNGVDFGSPVWAQVASLDGLSSFSFFRAATAMAPAWFCSGVDGAGAAETRLGDGLEEFRRRREVVWVLLG